MRAALPLTRANISNKMGCIGTPDTAICCAAHAAAWLDDEFDRSMILVDDRLPAPPHQRSRKDDRQDDNGQKKFFQCNDAYAGMTQTEELSADGILPGPL